MGKEKCYVCEKRFDGSDATKTICGYLRRHESCEPGSEEWEKSYLIRAHGLHDIGKIKERYAEGGEGNE